MKIRYYGNQHGAPETGVNLIRIECSRDHPDCYADCSDGQVNVSRHANAHDDDENPTLIGVDSQHHLEMTNGDSLRLPGCGCHFFVVRGEAVETCPEEPMTTIKLLEIKL